MSEHPSLRERLFMEATNALTVSGVAVVLALVAAVGFTWIGEFVPGGFFLAINVAVFVPWAYERHWPVEYSPLAAIVWTVSASLITAGLFVGLYQLSLGVTTEYADGIAFVVTALLQYAIAALFDRVRGST